MTATTCGQVCDALDEAETVKGKPTVIIADTVKGKGVPFMEGQFQFHNAPITQEQWEEAMRMLAAGRGGGLMKWKIGDRVQTRDAYGEALLELGPAARGHCRDGLGPPAVEQDLRLWAGAPGAVL